MQCDFAKPDATTKCKCEGKCNEDYTCKDQHKCKCNTTYAKTDATTNTKKLKHTSPSPAQW